MRAGGSRGRRSTAGLFACVAIASGCTSASTPSRAGDALAPAPSSASNGAGASSGAQAAFRGPIDAGACPSPGTSCDAGPTPVNAGWVDGGQLVFHCARGIWQPSVVSAPYLDIAVWAYCRP